MVGIISVVIIIFIIITIIMIIIIIIIIIISSSSSSSSSMVINYVFVHFAAAISRVRKRVSKSKTQKTETPINVSILTMSGPGKFPRR